MDESDKKEAEQKQEQEEGAKAAEGDQPATLKKAQTAAAARKDGEDVGSEGQPSGLSAVPCTHVLNL